jgi:protein-L-isoaspartate(D-aspartate) O-methyltransferase
LLEIGMPAETLRSVAYMEQMRHQGKNKKGVRPPWTVAPWACEQRFPICSGPALWRNASMIDKASERHAMVETQLRRRGITDEAVLTAMALVPRESFVPSGLERAAYADSPVGIGEGQTISQPFIVARMLECARVTACDRVLDIGTGSGYSAAVLKAMGAEVYTIERRPELLRQAEQRFADLDLPIHTRLGDGTLGWPEAAPFDAIIAAASGPDIPQTLKAQLRPGGRLVLPVGPSSAQTLLRITREGDGAFYQEAFDAVLFVPLIGAEGWPECP